MVPSCRQARSCPNRKTTVKAPAASRPSRMASIRPRRTECCAHCKATLLSISTNVFAHNSPPRRNVVRDEVLLGARHAVVVSPAVDQRQRRAEVAVPGRGVGGLPLQRGGVPGVAPRGLASEIALDQVVQKYHLDGAY